MEQAGRGGHALTPVPRQAETPRQAILNAAIGLLARHGSGRVTHRAIAADAGVSPGATTYHFPTLEDLVDEALALAAQRGREDLARWETALRASDDVAGTLARLAQQYVTEDPERAVLDYELYLAAVRRPQLRALAVMWVEDLCRILAPITDRDTARAIAALLDGAMLFAVATEQPISAEVLEPALRRMLGGAS